MMAGSANLKDGDRRTVTVVFADLSGFTGLSARLDPEEVDNLMNNLFSRFEAIIKTHGGGVEKYIGDAMVAVFGYPLIHEDDAVRAVTAALDFQDAVESYSGRLAGPPLRFRIGIHTGLITTGRRGEFEVVTGHTMSIASRVQAEAPIGGILASRATLDECGQEFLCSDSRQMSGKNLTETVEVCRLLGRNRQYLVAERPCIGREGLVDGLLRAYTKHQGEGLAGALLTGDAGIGKTAVVRSFVAEVRRLPDFRSPILWARARQFRNRPFAVITDLIANFVETDPRAPEASIRKAFAASTIPDPALVDAFVRFLAETTSYTGDSAQAFPLLASILRAIADRSRGSVWSGIIFVDNTDLADRQSLDFLSWFLHNSQPQPFLVLAEREPRQELLVAFAGLPVVEVEALDPADSRRLLQALLPDHTLESDAVNKILDQSAGVPLFLEAYARFVRSNPEGLSGMPRSVQNLFLTTISGYNEDIREFLRKMSIFRFNFTLDDALFIQERTEGDPDIVEPALGFFEREDILWQEKGSWFFRHDLFKTALYDSLLNFNKKILHGLVVELMRRQSSPHPVRMVYHLIRCDQTQAAIVILQSTPDAQTNLDFLPLIDSLLGGLDKADDHNRRLLSLTKASLLLNNGLNNQADSLLKDLLLQAFTDTDLRLTAGAYQLLAHYNRQSFRFQKSDFCARKALAGYRQISGCELEQAEVLATLCLNATSQGDETRALDCLAQLAALVARDPGLEHLAVQTKLERALFRGNYREAHLLGPDWKTDWAQLRLDELVPQLLQLTSQCCLLGTEMIQALCSLAVCQKLRANGSNWMDSMNQAEFQGLQVHNDFDRVLVCRHLAEAWYLLGEQARAETVALEGLALGERHSTFGPSFHLSCLLCELYWRQGKTDRARFFWQEALHIIELDLPVNRRDQIAHRYLGDALTCTTTGHQEAQSLLDQELLEIDNPGGQRMLLGLRCFAEMGTVGA